MRRLLIIPTRTLASSAAFSYDVEIVTEAKLDELRDNVRAFFREFLNVDLRDISDGRIDELFASHLLSADDLFSRYAQKPIAPPSSNRA